VTLVPKWSVLCLIKPTVLAAVLRTPVVALVN
jgi:hypothetical protein